MSAEEVQTPNGTFVTREVAEAHGLVTKPERKAAARKPAARKTAARKPAARKAAAKTATSRKGKR